VAGLPTASATIDGGVVWCEGQGWAIFNKRRSRSTEGVRATMAATRTIPIVFTTGTDPVAAGYVASMNRPGGNVTGLTNMTVELAAKRLNLLHEAVPKAGKIALLLNRNNPVVSQVELQAMQPAARDLGLEIIILNVGSDADLEEYDRDRSCFPLHRCGHRGRV
jgi:hypothetical protein